MEYILVAGGVGLCIGFSLGVLAMVLVKVPEPDPTPDAATYPCSIGSRTYSFASGTATKPGGRVPRVPHQGQEIGDDISRSNIGPESKPAHGFHSGPGRRRA